MGRRAKEEGQVISLFPFLSILACVIGVLTLMITALALGQMDTEGIEDAMVYQEKLNEIKKGKEEAERLGSLIDQARSVREQLASALAEIEEQKKLKQDAESSAQDHLPLLAESNRLKKRIAELEPDLKARQAQLEPLRRELAQRKEPPKEAEVKILPSGSGLNQEPTFVECTASGVVVYNEPEPWRVRSADLGTDQKFLKLLEYISQDEKRILIFLIRGDGVGTYSRAAYVARTNYARNGTLAVIGQGRIDLSVFKK